MGPLSVRTMRQAPRVAQQHRSLGTVAYTKLRQDACHVMLDRLLLKIEAQGNLLVAQPAGHSSRISRSRTESATRGRRRRRAFTALRLTACARPVSAARNFRLQPPFENIRQRLRADAFQHIALVRRH